MPTFPDTSSSCCTCPLRVPLMVFRRTGGLVSRCARVGTRHCPGDQRGASSRRRPPARRPRRRGLRLALSRRQAVQLNFQKRKTEIDLNNLPVYPTFDAELRRRLCLKVRRWMRTVRPYAVTPTWKGFSAGPRRAAGRSEPCARGPAGARGRCCWLPGGCAASATPRYVMPPDHGAPGGRGMGMTGRCVGGLSAQRSSHPVTRCWSSLPSF